MKHNTFHSCWLCLEFRQHFTKLKNSLTIHDVFTLYPFRNESPRVNLVILWPTFSTKSFPHTLLSCKDRSPRHYDAHVQKKLQTKCSSFHKCPPASKISKVFTLRDYEPTRSTSGFFFLVRLFYLFIIFSNCLAGQTITLQKLFLADFIHYETFQPMFI